MGKAGGIERNGLKTPKGQVVKVCQPENVALGRFETSKKGLGLFRVSKFVCFLVSNRRTGISHVGESGNFEVEVVGV